MYRTAKKRIVFLRILTLLASAAVWITCIPSPAHADSLTDKYNALQQQLQEQQNILNSANAQYATETQKKAALQNSIELNTQQIDILRLQISTLNAQVDSKNREIEAMQANINTEYAKFKTQLRNLYEMGDTTYISVLLESSDFDDFLSRLDILYIVSDHNNKIMNTLTQAQAKLNADQTALKSNQASLLSTKSTFDAKQAELDREIAQQSQIISQKAQDINISKEKQKEINAQLDIVNAERAAAAKHNNATGAQIVAYAKQYAGHGYPYVFNTNGPDTFDCSGLTQWVYANVAGIALPHYADDQAMGKTIVTVNGKSTIVIRGHKITSKSDLQPGDLVFFHTQGDTEDGYAPSYAGHVGIYVGPDQILAANTSEYNPVYQNIDITPWSYFDGYNTYLWGWRFLD